jgi:hypothetical protein
MVLCDMRVGALVFGVPLDAATAKLVPEPVGSPLMVDICVGVIALPPGSLPAGDEGVAAGELGVALLLFGHDWLEFVDGVVGGHGRWRGRGHGRRGRRHGRWRVKGRARRQGRGSECGWWLGSGYNRRRERGNSRAAVSRAAIRRAAIRHTAVRRAAVCRTTVRRATVRRAAIDSATEFAAEGAI